MAMLKRLLMVLVAVLLIAVPASLAQGAPGGGGPPDGKGGGPPADSPRPDVGGGRPDGAGTKKGDIYADLWVIARFDDGRPLVDTEGCVRPITFASVVPEGAQVDYLTGLTQFSEDDAYDYGEPAYEVPLVHDSDLAAEEPCDVDPAYASFEYQGDFYPYVSETELGRLNLGRAPEKVVDKQLRDVIVNLTAVDAVRLDPSGRLQGEATIDSPLQNLAVFQAILERGLIQRVDKDGDPIEEIDTGGLALLKFQQAATALAAATPKEDDFHVYVDTVQYLSRILSIPDDTIWLSTITASAPASPIIP